MPISCQFVVFLAKPMQGIPLIATSTLTSNVETRFSMSSQMAMISIAWIGRFICKNTKTWRDTEADLGKLGLCSGSTDLLGRNGWWLILCQKCAPRSCDILQSNQSLKPTPSIIPMLLLPYFSTLIFPISCHFQVCRIFTSTSLTLRASSMHQRRFKKVGPARINKVWQEAKKTGRHIRLASHGPAGVRLAQLTCGG